MDKGRLTQKQVIFLSISYIFATMFVTLPRSLTSLSQHTGWLCILLAMVLFAGYAYFLCGLIREIGEQTFIGFIHSLLGKWLGPPLTLLLFLIPTLLYSAYVLRLVTELFATLVIPETPVEVMIGMFLVLRYWNVRGGLRSIGMLAEILFPPVYAVLAIMLLLAIGNTEHTRVLPLFDTDFQGLFTGTMSVFSIYAEIGILLFVASRIHKREDTMKSIVVVNIVVGLLFLLTYWLCLGTFGTAYTQRLAFPTVEMVRNISVANFFEHMELIFLTMWVLMHLAKGSITFYACCIGFQSWFGLKSYKTLMVPMLVIIYFICIIPQNLVQAVFRFEQFKSLIYPYYGLGTAVTLYVWARMRKRRAGS